MALNLEVMEQIRQQNAKYCRYLDTMQFDAWEPAHGSRSLQMLKQIHFQGTARLNIEAPIDRLV